MEQEKWTKTLADENLEGRKIQGKISVFFTKYTRQKNIIVEKSVEEYDSTKTKLLNAFRKVQKYKKMSERFTPFEVWCYRIVSMDRHKRCDYDMAVFKKVKPK